MNTNVVWLKLIKDLLETKGFKSPRGMKTKEIVGYQTVIPMAAPYVTVANRKIGEKFRAAEAAWILSGDNRVATISPYSKIIHTFSDDGVRFFGSYGPKVVDQLSYIIDTLKYDPESRQAVINIWREKPPKSKDVPCTCSLQFIIRDSKLHCIATMRSSDAWLGWVYDVFNFSCIANYILLQLKSQHQKGYSLGNLILNAGSQHSYEQHWEKAQTCLSTKSNAVSFLKTTFPNGNEFITELWKEANG